MTAFQGERDAKDPWLHRCLFSGRMWHLYEAYVERESYLVFFTVSDNAGRCSANSDFLVDTILAMLAAVPGNQARLVHSSSLTEMIRLEER